MLELDSMPLAGLRGKHGSFGQGPVNVRRHVVTLCRSVQSRDYEHLKSIIPLHWLAKWLRPPNVRLPFPATDALSIGLNFL
jgi:hypothetical protein